MTGMVSAIQRFSTKDGPGIRTTVFLKGCNLSCLWCHNPESIGMGKILKYISRRCNHCGDCTAVCRFHAVRMVEGKRELDPELCTGCGACEEVCFNRALEMTGQCFQEDELVEELKKDQQYFSESGGGVTFSGGEPLLQSKFLSEVLRKLGRENIHRAVDTALHIGWKHIEQVIPFTDLFLIDLKGMDPQKHKSNIGVDPALIHQNVENLSAAGKHIIARIPLILDLRDDLEDIRQTAQFLKRLPSVRGVELLAYHNLGVEKAAMYETLDAQQQYTSPPQKKIDQVAEIFRAAEISLTV